MSVLNIRQDPCDLDFLSFGALIHRLDPGVIPFRKARSFDIHVSGGEYNVAASLADCFRPEHGNRDGDGELPDRRARASRGCAKLVSSRFTSGSSTTACAVPTSPPSTATAAMACGHRWSSTIEQTRPAPCSNRATSIGPRSSAAACAGSIPAAFSHRLSETTAPLIIEGMQAARAAGAVTSFDLELSRQTLGVCRGRRARPASHEANRRPARCARRQ